MAFFEKILAIVGFKSAKQEENEGVKMDNTVSLTEQASPLEKQAELSQVEDSVETENSGISAKSASDEKATSSISLPQGDYILPTTEWFAQYEMVAGISHRKAPIPLPCQDSAIAFTDRPTVIIADGAGTSVVSDLGSKAVVTGLARFIKTMNHQFSELLDKESTQEKQRELALLLVKHAKGILEDLSTEHRRPLKDFRCTLLLAIVGKVHTLWVKVGDGALVIERKKKSNGDTLTELSTLGEIGKGEYANATTFIDEHLQPDDVQSGVLDSQYITALFAMSDGSAEKFVSTNGDKVAGRLASWADLLRQDRLYRYQLTKSFYAEDFLNGHTGDDCCIAMISAKLS